MASAPFAVALLAAASTGADGAAGMAEVTADEALLKKPLTLSSRGAWSWAHASAGRASKTVDEMRMMAVCVRSAAL